MIRAYRDSDLDSVLHIWLQASKLAHPFLSPEFLADERERVRNLYMPTARSWVYEMDGQVVGFIALVENEVGGLFVQPDRQRGGVGRALMDTARNLHPILEVEVFKENSIGRSFYSKYGFQVIAESVDAETGRPVLRMRHGESADVK